MDSIKAEIDLAVEVQDDVKQVLSEESEGGLDNKNVEVAQKDTSEVKDEMKRKEETETFDKVKEDGGKMETEIGEKQKMESEDKLNPALIQDTDNENCTLDEEPHEGLAETEANISNMSASWRDSSTNQDDFDEDEEDDFSDEDDYSDDYEDEEAAEEWLTRYYLRQKGLPEALANLPSTIKISVVPETEEDRQRREEKQREELARRKEEFRKKMTQQANQSQEKGKRKFGSRMTLEEAVRDDFESGQDYVDFLNSKLQNVSIKVTR